MKFRKSLYFLASASVIAPVAVQAQGSDSLSQDIIVTALKRTSSVQKVPAAITAVSGEALLERGITEPKQLQSLVPSMTGGSLRGDTVIAIRGVGLNAIGATPGVAIHVDGVYQPRPAMGDLAQIDIERVEVLRGPQGTLYGRNANGGVINFITNEPGNDLGGYLKASYESYDEYRVQGAVDIPISDAVSVRATVDRWERGEGFVKNIIPGGQDLDKGASWAGRLHFVAEVTPELKASLIVNHFERNGPFVYFTSLSAPSADSIALNPFFANAIVPLEPRKTAQNDPAFQDRKYSSFTGILDWSMGDVTVKSITAYQRFRDDFAGDFDSTNITGSPIEQEQLAKTFSQELNVSGSIGPVDAVVGAFYLRDKFTGNLHFTFTNGAGTLAANPAMQGPPLPPGSTNDANWTPYITKTYALFGDLTLNISDSLRVIGGLRWSKDKQRITQNNFLRALTPGGFVVIGPASCPNRTNELEFESTTPRAVVQYDTSPDGNVYASYSKGFKVGGFNYRSGCGANFKPEKVTSYEIGTKNRLADGLATVNASAFYYDYRNLQVEQLVGFAFRLDNAPKARVMGVELETVIRPDDHLTINANAAYIDAEFREYFNLDILNRPLPEEPLLKNLRGNPIPNAPKVTANVGVAYETDPIIAGGTLTFRADVNYRSRIYYREFGNKADSQSAYALLNGSIEWQSDDEKLALRLYGKNLTGKEYYSLMAQSAFTDTRFVSWGSPRQIGIEAKVNF